MSDDAARALVRRLSTDTEFAERLRDLPPDERRALLDSEGYEGVRLKHMANALPESSGGELSDEEFAAVVGAGSTETDLVSVASAVSGATLLGGPAAYVLASIA